MRIQVEICEIRKNREDFANDTKFLQATRSTKALKWRESDEPGFKMPQHKLTLEGYGSVRAGLAQLELKLKSPNEGVKNVLKKG